MNRPVSLVLLVVGLGLLFYGYQASDSVESKMSEMFEGVPSDQVMWFYIGGAVCVVLGIAGLSRGRGKGKSS